MKKILPYKTASEMITIYNIQDLVDNFSVIEEALSLWKSKCEEYKKLHGDEGTSLLGAGIAVYFLPPQWGRFRKSY